MVNEGSDNISAFRVKRDGALDLVPGSPFASGGKQPCCLALNHELLHIVNRGDGILATQTVPGSPIAGTPGGTNYCACSVQGNGSLTLLPNLTLQAPDGSSPSQVVAARDGEFLIANTFLTPPPPSNMPFAPIFPDSHSDLFSFRVQNQNLVVQPSVTLPVLPQFEVGGVFRPFILGMQVHPEQPILYAGAVTAGQLTVWNWNHQGNLSFVDTTAGVGGMCWLAMDPKARFLYSSNVVPNTIGVFSLHNPQAPVMTQNFALGGLKAPLVGQAEPYGFTTEPFNLAVAPSGDFLYVVNHTTCTNDYGNNTDSAHCTAGNAIHILKISATNGMLSEQPFSPLVLPLPAPPNYRNLHPKGLVVMDIEGDDNGDEHGDGHGDESRGGSRD